MNNKFVTAPVKNGDLDNDLESNTVYIFDYDKSQHYENELDFIRYINNIGITADIYFENTPKEIRFKLLNYYLTSDWFNHFTSFNVAILNSIFYLKNTSYRLRGSALSSDMEHEFANLNKEILYKWIDFFDSYFIYMLMVATNKDKEIKNRYSKEQLTDDESLSPNIVSLFIDEFFYDYYKSGVNTDNIKYWTYYYDNLLYDNKPFNIIMMNPSNFIFKIMHDTSTNDKWENFLEESFNKSRCN